MQLLLYLPAVIPENHHVGGRLWEGGDEAGDTEQSHEGEQQAGTSAAAGSRKGEAETADTATHSVVLHKQTHTPLEYRWRQRLLLLYC